MRWTVIVGLLVVLWLVAFAVARLRRPGRIALVPGEALRRELPDVPARVFVDVPLPGGLLPGTTNRRRLRLLLSDQRLVAVSWRGVVLEARAGEALRAVSTGPRRLVLEGTRRSRRSGRTGRLRMELVVPDAEAWAAELSTRFPPIPPDPDLA